MSENVDIRDRAIKALLRARGTSGEGFSATVLKDKDGYFTVHFDRGELSYDNGKQWNPSTEPSENMGPPTDAEVEAWEADIGQHLNEHNRARTVALMRRARRAPAGLAELQERARAWVARHGDGDAQNRSHEIIAELRAERDRLRDVLESRHGGECTALLAELDEARAERDELREKLERAEAASAPAALKRLREWLDRREWYADPSDGDGCAIMQEVDRLLAECEAGAEPNAWTPSGCDYDRSIHSNTDQYAWADFFLATFPHCGADRDTMAGWFANAMMAKADSMPQRAAVPADVRKWAEESSSKDAVGWGWSLAADWILSLPAEPEQPAEQPDYQPPFEGDPSECAFREQPRDAGLPEHLRGPRFADFVEAEDDEQPRDDGPLLDWLERYDHGVERGYEWEEDSAALAELCRRAVGGGR